MEATMEYERANKKAIDVDLGGGLVAADQLRSIIERIERLEGEKKTISDDIKDVMSEAKANGFDAKAIKTILKLRKKDENERTEEEMILDTYMKALGMRQPDLFDEAA